MRLTKNREIKIGKKLKENRIANGYTQEKVAEILGCSPRYIGQLETDVTTGSISISIILIIKLNLFLSISSGCECKTPTPRGDSVQLETLQSR